jgi:hypothetical protein
MKTAADFGGTLRVIGGFACKLNDFASALRY